MLNLAGFNSETGEWNDSLTGDYIWGNTNIGEALSIVMTPFTWSMVGDAFGEMELLPGYASVGNIGGRPYQNGSVMFAALQAAGKKLDDLVREMGGSRGVPEDLTIPPFSLPRLAILRLLPQALKFRVKEKRGLRQAADFVAQTPRWCRDSRQHIAQAQEPQDLIAFWPRAMARIRAGFWVVVATNWRYVAVNTPLRRELVKLVGEAGCNDLLSGVSQEGELLASLGPVVALDRVARGELKRETYLALYGHRGTYETELSVPRPAEEPDWLDRQLAAWERDPHRADALLAQQQAAFTAAWERLERQRPGRAPALRRQLDQVAAAARLREATRSEYARLAWVGRSWALQAGALTGINEELFCLTGLEVLDLLGGKGAPVETLPTRQATYARYRELPPYPGIISGRFDPFAWVADPERRSDYYDSHGTLAPPAGAADARIITGLAGSAGCVEGRVRRLDRPEDEAQLRPGEILVTVQTNIGWTLLFPRLAAVVTDVGAPLSHAAIVARELGIPAVVGCGDATRRLRNGDRVRVDGTRGLVELLEAASDS